MVAVVRTGRVAVPTDAGDVRRIIAATIDSFAFYFAGPINDWTAPQNGALWQDRVKTLFDPCPADWRVPQGGEGERSLWRSFGTAEFHYVHEAWSDELGGALWNLSAHEVWYSGCGCRYSVLGGMLTRVDRESDCWTTTFAGGNYYNFSAQPTLIYVSGTYHPAAGFPVRCVRE